MKKQINNEKPSLIPSDKSKEVTQEEIRERLMGALDDVEDENKEKVLVWYVDFGQKMWIAASSCYSDYLKKMREQDKNLYMKSLEKLTSDAIKKPRFTTDEAMKITGIRSKGTIIKYFKDGTIHAKQDPRHHWFVLREDLAEYVGHDNF